MSPVPRLLLAVSGQGRMRAGIGGEPREVPFVAGDCLAVDPMAWNRPLPAGMGFVVLFDHGDHLRCLFWSQTRRAGLRRSEPSSVDRVPRSLHHAWQALLALEPRIGDGPVVASLCRAVWTLGRDHLANGQVETVPGRRLWRAFDAWIDEALHHPIDRNQAAQAFGVHPGTVTRVFREHAPAGFTATVITRRLERAAALLRDTSLPIAEVGQRCGYPDPAAFSTAFRKRYGDSPSRYRG